MPIRAVKRKLDVFFCSWPSIDFSVLSELVVKIIKRNLLAVVSKDYWHVEDD